MRLRVSRNSTSELMMSFAIDLSVIQDRVGSAPFDGVHYSTEPYSFHQPLAPGKLNRRQPAIP